MNTLGTIKQFEDLIHQGFGYKQLCEKLNLTEADIKSMIKEYPAFALVISSRYGIVFDEEKEEEQTKQPKPLKRKKKSEEPQQTSNEGVTNANETVSKGE